MGRLTTIQKREKLNNVYALDGRGNGNAYHRYSISTAQEPSDILVEIQFQNGPRNQEGSTRGIIDTDLLEIVRDRMIGFSQGEYATRENAIALTHIEEALLWLNKRVEDRIERGVMGTMKK